MSYIEKKYKNKISEILNDLKKIDNDVLELLNHKSIQYTDEIAKLCALCNKQINLILKTYYPEIKSLDDKLEIKSNLKFYFHLIDNLTDFVRNVEEIKKIDEKYYDTIIKFIRDKENLISGKYKAISAQELTAFYDQKTRDNLEKIVAEKFERKTREYFAMGPLEEEIKKIAKISGAKSVVIKVADESYEEYLESAQSVIIYETFNETGEKGEDNIEKELKKFLESKNYKVLTKSGLIITNAKLLPDK